MNPEEAISRKFIFPSGIFSIEQEHNIRYIIVPILFARELLGYQDEVSSIELKLQPGVNAELFQNEIIQILGN